jgi:hypothetical protein
MTLIRRDLGRPFQISGNAGLHRFLFSTNYTKNSLCNLFCAVILCTSLCTLWDKQNIAKLLCVKLSVLFSLRWFFFSSQIMQICTDFLDFWFFSSQIFLICSDFFRLNLRMMCLLRRDLERPLQISGNAGLHRFLFSTNYIKNSLNKLFRSVILCASLCTLWDKQNSPKLLCVKLYFLFSQRWIT